MNRRLVALGVASLVGVFTSSAVSAQTTWIGNFHGQTDRLYDDYDWAQYYWKGECGPGAPILAGVSGYWTSNYWGLQIDWWTEAILCSSSSIVVDYTDNYVLTNAVGDDRADTSTGDWAYGSFKAECGATDVMVGLDQTTDYAGSNFTGARCMGTTNMTGATDCHTVAFSGQDTRELPTFGGDWSQGFFKGQCGAGRYVKGVARWHSDSHEEASEILCCTPVF